MKDRGSAYPLVPNGQAGLKPGAKGLSGGLLCGWQGPRYFSNHRLPSREHINKQVKQRLEPGPDRYSSMECESQLLPQTLDQMSTLISFYKIPSKTGKEGKEDVMQSVLSYYQLQEKKSLGRKEKQRRKRRRKSRKVTGPFHSKV